MKSLVLFLLSLSFFSAITAAADNVDGKNIYKAAVANEQRSAEDRESDKGRKPAQVLQFFGIERGMRVLDLYSGGGYYSELLSYIVGDDGQVIAHTNKAYTDFLGEETNKRLANNRLANVEVLRAENNALSLPANELDAAIMILAYHDIYLVDEENDWPKIDGEKLLAELLNGLKPGGILGLVDHVAAPGSAATTGGTIHRIDPALVIREVEAAGFVLDGESDVLRNPADDWSVSMYDPSVRGKTDRFILRFRKPDA